MAGPGEYKQSAGNKPCDLCLTGFFSTAVGATERSSCVDCFDDRRGNSVFTSDALDRPVEWFATVRLGYHCLTPHCTSHHALRARDRSCSSRHSSHTPTVPLNQRVLRWRGDPCRFGELLARASNYERYFGHQSADLRMRHARAMPGSIPE